MTQDYFALFSLEPKFNIALDQLESQYRKLQSASHPDRFVTASSAEKLKSMQLATLVNEAYQTLKRPAARAQYILAQRGIEAITETNTAMPVDFLMQQMEWREAMDDAKSDRDITSLETLLLEIRQTQQTFNTELIQLIDQNQDLTQATETTRKLIFMDKVCADIHHMMTEIEN